MGKSVNKIILVGNVGHDPEVQQTANGSSLVKLSLATSRRVQRDDGYEDRTEWHRLTLWDRLAEIARDYVHKGDRLYVEGRMEYGSYEKEGAKFTTSEVNVRELVLLGGRRPAKAT